MYTLFLIQERRDGDTRVLLYPQDEYSFVMLRHVADGMTGVTTEFWNATVKPLVNMHGWEYQINVIDAE